MYLPLPVIAIGAACLFAQDITVSKDSLRVYNSLVSSKADAVIFVSNSSSAINLDSARIVIKEMDTTGLGIGQTGQRMEAAWSANTSMNPFYIWRLESAGNNEYLLTESSFLPSGAQAPLTFNKIGDSSALFKFSIGYCLIPECRPHYPALLRGTLKLFFSNKQIVSLVLYSDDLRKKTPSAPRRGSINTCMFGDSLDFSQINDSCQKRITDMTTCTFNTCPVAIPDVRIAVSAVLAPAGVRYLGTSSDPGCLDTLKRVPQSGYGDSAGFDYSGGHLFAIKTFEGNYAALHLLASGSGVPFRYFKWIYQPDASPQFIKETSIKTDGPPTAAGIGSVRCFIRRGALAVSWTPVSGTVRWGLFGVDGKKFYAGETDGGRGSAVVPLQYANMPVSTIIVRLHMPNGALTVRMSPIVVFNPLQYE